MTSCYYYHNPFIRIEMFQKISNILYPWYFNLKYFDWNSWLNIEQKSTAASNSKDEVMNVMFLSHSALTPVIYLFRFSLFGLIILCQLGLSVVQNWSFWYLVTNLKNNCFYFIYNTVHKPLLNNLYIIIIYLWNQYFWQTLMRYHQIVKEQVNDLLSQYNR